ncbi:MAG: S-methyl-5'-thioadenosine phosphorylase [Chthoniobacterales bacterium]
MENGLPAGAAVGVIGGSGLYDIEGFEGAQEHVIETPFGPPSDAIVGGTLHGRTVYFLPRHGRGHRIAPHEINHRANIYALRSLGVRWLISVTAVGSLQERYAPRDIVLPAQFYDRMSCRERHTFFGGGIVAHISFAEPISTQLRTTLAQTCSALRKNYHSGGTHICMDGPAFSTRAESETYRKAGFDVIGMTTLPEAKLAREAEIAFAAMAMVSDYDCWKTSEDPVTAESVSSHLEANAATAKEVLSKVIPRIPTEPNWPEHCALDDAIVTSRADWPQETLDKLRVLLERFQ